LPVTQEKTVHSGRPKTVLPAGACDCHCHVFGPAERYKPVVTAGYTLPVGSPADYLETAGRLGLERRVFIQPITYGPDSSCILDAMRMIGQSARGIGGIPEGKVADAALSDWHAAGLRGMRVNHTPYKPFEAGFADHALPEIERAAALTRELGWMLEILAPYWLVKALLPHLTRLRVPFSLCHFGKFPAALGTGHPEFHELVARFRDSGNFWIKIAAAYQISARADLADVAPVAQALYAAAPDRVIWGTDWPHMRHEEQGDTAGLLDLFASWFPDESARRRILVDNPARLFGF
jgi:2-pyrone-4,6-dicarboxylate lactonase